MPWFVIGRNGAKFEVVANQFIEDWKNATPEKINPLVKKAFATVPKDREEVTRRYGGLFDEIEAQWQVKKKSGATKLDDPAAEQLRQVLYGPNSPCEVPEGMLSEIDQFFATADIEALWKQRKIVDRVLIDSPAAPPQALILEDKPVPVNAPVFRRGNPATLGDEVPHRFLTALNGKSFTNGSGRHELAKAIVDPANPLTARVLVNRVWQHHFGTGLVQTASDFGSRAEPPSHPELLDWLAAEFVKGGWSLKKLHRTIMISATYQQAAAGAPSPRDPENRLLSRMTPHRLTFEELRDTLFAATNDLDFTAGGKAVPLFVQPFAKRRTVYGEIDREYLPGLLRAFDFANPDLHVAQRSDTTVPQQSLFFLNHPLALDRARALAAHAEVVGQSPNEKVTWMVRQVYQREPTPRQMEQALAFVAAAGAEAAAAPKKDDWAYGYGDWENDKVINFKRLATFTGEASAGRPFLAR